MATAPCHRLLDDRTYDPATGDRHGNPATATGNSATATGDPGNSATGDP